MRKEEKGKRRKEKMKTDTIGIRYDKMRQDNDTIRHDTMRHNATRITTRHAPTALTKKIQNGVTSGRRRKPITAWWAKRSAATSGREEKCWPMANRSTVRRRESDAKTAKMRYWKSRAVET